MRWQALYSRPAHPCPPDSQASGQREDSAEVVAAYPELEPADIQQAMEYAARG